MLNFRYIKADDKEFYMNSVKDFYNSEAALHSIPDENIEKTFDLAIKTSPFIELYIIEQDGVRVGYALLLITYSQEAGGKAVWLDELYILPKFQGQGIGGTFLEYLKSNYDVPRLRLEYAPVNKSACEVYKKHGFKPLEYKQMIYGN